LGHQQRQQQAQRQQRGGLVDLHRSRFFSSRAESTATPTAAAAHDDPGMGGATHHDARVVTYNVLSSSLCEASYFTHCAPEDLDPPTRLARVLAKLEPEVAAGAVIALQEVSQKWAGDLHVFFAQRGCAARPHLTIVSNPDVSLTPTLTSYISTPGSCTLHLIS
jgi:hypothetical protein